MSTYTVRWQTVVLFVAVICDVAEEQKTNEAANMVLELCGMEAEQRSSGHTVI